MSTAEKVLQALEAYDLKPLRAHNEFQCNSPLRTGSNSHAFSVKIEGDEHGTFYDHVSGAKGSLYDLAKLLGVPLPETQNQALDTHISYKGLDEYAQVHGVTGDVFRKAAWKEVTHRNRPALAFETQTGVRWRFLDDAKPRYDSPVGYQRCWYGLDRAITLARQTNTAIIIVNGEASTVVGLHFGVPACCVTGGEKELPPHCLQELQAKWNGDVWVALDCDATGKEYAPKIVKQIGDKALMLDMGLTNGGDMADYCRLYEHSALPELTKLAAPKLDGITTRAVATGFVQQLVTNTRKVNHLYIPFKSFHALGGFAKILSPKKLCAIVAPSAHGKTSWLETWADRWLIEGEGGLWYGSEWDEREYHIRRIQRYSGISYDTIREHELFMSSDGRIGTALTDTQLYEMERVGHMVSEWRGQMEYFPAAVYLEDTLNSMSNSLRYRRKHGERVTFAVLDYVQLLRMRSVGTDRTNNLFEHATGTFKEWCIEHDIVGLVGAQVTKEKSKDSKRGRLIDASDANYLREDKFNLFVTLNIVYEIDRDKPVDKDGQPALMPTTRGVANIVKNSAGRTGAINVYTDFPHYAWIDKQWTTYREDIGD